MKMTQNKSFKFLANWTRDTLTVFHKQLVFKMSVNDTSFPLLTLTLC